MPVRAPMPLLFPVMAALVGTVGATAEPARFTIAYSQAHHPAAAELRRYLYLLTQQQCVEAEPLESSLTDEAAGGCLPALLELRDDTDAAVLNSTLHASAGLFVLAGSNPAEERTAFEFLDTALEGWAPLGTAGAVDPGEHDHVVHSTGPLTVCHGATTLATKYAVFSMLEAALGVGFRLHGDALPAPRPAAALVARLAQHGRRSWSPGAVDTRGIQPFHDFAEGPDQWNVDDYKLHIDQLAKLKMNFIGLHTYPGDEPTVWTGCGKRLFPSPFHTEKLSLYSINDHFTKTGSG